MFVKIELIPPNKDYIFLRNQNGQLQKIPRVMASHVRTNDICQLSQDSKRLHLKVLTDEDIGDIVKSMVLYQPNQIIKDQS